MPLRRQRPGYRVFEKTGRVAMGWKLRGHHLFTKNAVPGPGDFKKEAARMTHEGVGCVFEDRKISGQRLGRLDRRRPPEPKLHEISGEQFEGGIKTKMHQ